MKIPIKAKIKTIPPLIMVELLLFVNWLVGALIFGALVAQIFSAQAYGPVIIFIFSAFIERHPGKLIL